MSRSFVLLALACTLLAGCGSGTGPSGPTPNPSRISRTKFLAFGDSFTAGDRDASAEAQRSAAPLAAEIVGRMGVAGVKAAMDRVGLNGGRVRAPLMPLGIEDEARVDALLRDARVTAAV